VDGFGDGGVAGFEAELGLGPAGQETGSGWEVFFLGRGGRGLFEPCRNLRGVARGCNRLPGAFADGLEGRRTEKVAWKSLIRLLSKKTTFFIATVLKMSRST